MKLSQSIPRALLAFVAVCIAQILAGILIPMKPVALPHFLQWLLLSNAVTVAAQDIVAARTAWRGWRLGIAVAAIPVVIHTLDMLEGIVFLKNSPVDWGRIFVYTLVSAALSVPVWMLLFGRRDNAASKHHPVEVQSPIEWAWKFVVSDLAYLSLYFLAGTIIWPYVKNFYATQYLPSRVTISELQLLIRGPVFILLCLFLVRMLRLPRLIGALAVGAVFTLLSGVAPLLIPNPYFPDIVRWAHFCEVTSSNFVFGAIVAWLWGQREPAPAHVLHTAA
jgi:hypothetical protein